MPSWSDISAEVVGSLKSIFGDSTQASYQQAAGGVAIGKPFPVTIVRSRRVTDEYGHSANFEEVRVDPADFTAPPVKGDWLTAWGTQYVVTATRQPDPYGWFVLVLQQRAGQAVIQQ